MKKIYIITMVLVLLIGVVLSFALYSNSPFNKVKANNVYEEDENRSAATETKGKTIPYEEDENSNAVPKEGNNSDDVPSRKEVPGDAVQSENGILGDSGDDEDSGNQDNCTYDSNKNGTDDNDNSKEQQVEYDIELEIEPYAKSILVSSGTETVYFYAETFIETEEILLIDSSTGSTVATMVDDGQYPISGDDLMNDNVFSCKVEIDTSNEKIYEFYAAIGNDGNDAIMSNTEKIKVYVGFTEKELFDREEVFTTLENWKNSDEFKSLDLDSKVKATLELLVDLSENGTENAPYSLFRRDTICFDEDNYLYTFRFYRGGIGAISLVEY